MSCSLTLFLSRLQFISKTIWLWEHRSISDWNECPSTCKNRKLFCHKRLRLTSKIFWDSRINIRDTKERPRRLRSKQLCRSRFMKYVWRNECIWMWMCA